MLEDGDRFYITSFFELITCRNFEGVIPWTAIKEYADHYGVTGEWFDEFSLIIRSLDVEQRGLKKDG